MKDILREFMTGLARWPLLLASVLCYVFALYEEMITDNTEVLIGVAGMVVGSVLLGGWLVSYIVAGERDHYAKHRPIWTDPPKQDAPPSRSEEDGAGSLSEGTGEATGS